MPVLRRWSGYAPIYCLSADDKGGINAYICVKNAGIFLYPECIIFILLYDSSIRICQSYHIAVPVESVVGLCISALQYISVSALI